MIMWDVQLEGAILIYMITQFLAFGLTPSIFDCRASCYTKHGNVISYIWKNILSNVYNKQKKKTKKQINK